MKKTNRQIIVHMTQHRKLNEGPAPHVAPVKDDLVKLICFLNPCSLSHSCYH